MAGRSAILLLLLCSCATGRVTPAPTPTGSSNPPVTQTIPVTPTPAPPPAPPPPAPGPFIVFFDWDKDEITPQAAAILDNAAQAYRATGRTTIQLAPTQSGANFDPDLAEQRFASARLYLARQGIWARPVILGSDGTWRPWSASAADSAAPPVLLLGPLPTTTPVAGPPPSPPSPPSPPRPPRPAQGRPAAARPASGLPAPTATATASLEDLPAETVWLTPTGTLRTRPLEALLQECLRLEGEISAECQALADAGSGGFGRVPQLARKEFSFLLKDCRGSVVGERCAARVRLERAFRSFSRGVLDPGPLKMVEKDETHFIARIIDDPSRAGTGAPGVAIGAPDDPSRGGSEGERETVLPFSDHMCFRLTAAVATDFRIKPRGKLCMDRSPAGGQVAFRPEWDVTPLRSGTLNLLLVTELFVEGRKVEFPHTRYPLPIDVKPKPSLWDRIDNAIRRATATVNLAAGLAEALGTLFAIIAGWAIWSWLRRRKKRRRSE